MKQINPLDHFSDQEILARTLYGEARGERKKFGEKALEAIAHVILNRYNKKNWYGNSIKDICLKPFQFSCWNRQDPNYSHIMASHIYDGIYLQCQKIAHFFNEQKDHKRCDFTKGATHYHHRLISPYWIENQSPTYQIGNHVFYQL